MNSKKTTIINGFVLFSTVLLAMPANSMPLVDFPETTEIKAAGRYPAESLTTRLQRLSRSYKTHISFDAATLRAVRVTGTQKGKSLEEDLRNSLAGTRYAFRHLGGNAYAVYAGQKAATVSATSVAQRTSRTAKPSAVRTAGKLSGMVTDSKGLPVIGATVRIEGKQVGAATDAGGKFTFSAPQGTYNVEITCLSYSRTVIRGVKITAGRSTPLSVVLQEATTNLAGVTVTADYNRANANALYAQQKNMIAMSDGISADLMKKTSDNNVAQVLRRVPGVTIESGKYVNVRGMGERYNNVELNGAALPSTEPNRRNFSFDVIPSALIDNVTIAKTFTPDLPGEFTGGLINVQTLAVPQKKFFNLTVGTGMNTQSTGKDFLSNKRYGADYLFGETGKREWYAGPTADDMQQSMKNAAARNSYGLRRFTAAPVQNYTAVAGVPFRFGQHKAGAVIALTYRNEQTTDLMKTGAMFLNGDSIYRDSHRYRFVTAAGMVANAGWEMPGHKITWRNLYNSRFTHTNMERFRTRSYNNGMQIMEQYSVPLVSRMFQTQLEGEHHLFTDKLILTWNASYNKVKRTNPDNRYATGDLSDLGEHPAEFDENGNPIAPDWSLSSKYSPLNFDEGHTMYSGLEEKKKNAGINLEYPFIVAGNRQSVKGGYMGTFRNADYAQVYLKPYNPKFYSANRPSIEHFFDPSNFGAKDDDTKLHYESAMGVPDADGYKGKQRIHAAYVMGEFTFLQKLHLTTGVRMEKAFTQVATKMYDRQIQKRVDSVAVVRKTDFLPSVTVVYNILDNLNVRFAYSRTIARPDFRELTANEYYNVEDQVRISGMGRLRQSVTDNYDFRLEWYPRPGEVLSASAFYKKFHDIMELVSYLNSDHTSYTFYPFNLDKATVRGLELNLRKSMGFIAPGSFLKDLYVSGNFTWLKGNVNYNLGKSFAEASGKPFVEDNPEDWRERPLLGLSPYTLNAGLMYQGDVFGAALNYGRKGRTIVVPGMTAQMDQYMKPRDILDLQLSARFLKQRLEVKFNASDLLNQDEIVYSNASFGGVQDFTGKGMGYNDGDWIISRIKHGVNLSLSVGYRF